MKTLPLYFLIFIVCSCKPGKNASKETTPVTKNTASTSSENPPKIAPIENPSEQNDKNQVNNKSQLPDTIRLVVSLISIGAGTDQEAGAELESYVSSFSDKSGKKILFNVVTWGREGEADYCFDLKDLDTGEQREFIDGLYVMFKERNLVQIIENMKNRFRRN